MKRSKFVRSDEQLLVPLLGPLFDDVVECEELLDRADTQFARRAFVRAAFAFNEGYIYWLKEKTIEWVLLSAKISRNIDAHKLVTLFDETYRPNGQGKLESEQNRLPFKNLCAFVMRSAAECWGLDPAPFFSDNGWNELQNSLKVRHRITHPKKPDDLEVTDSDLQSISNGHVWLLNCFIAIVQAAEATSSNTAS